VILTKVIKLYLVALIGETTVVEKELSSVYQCKVLNIVIKPGPAVGSQVSWVNLDQSRKILKKIFKVLIFNMKKLRKNSCEYRLYML